MQKATLNYIVDLGLFLSFLAVAATGILKISLVARSINGLPFNVITPLHDISGVVLVLLALVHLVLHWDWIVCMTKGFFSRKKC